MESALGGYAVEIRDPVRFRGALNMFHVKHFHNELTINSLVWKKIFGGVGKRVYMCEMCRYVICTHASHPLYFPPPYMFHVKQ
jgi:hypothetical protein